MKKIKFLLVLLIIIFSSLVFGMNSTNYNIDVSVIGSGGGETSTANYNTNIVLGALSGEVADSNYAQGIGFFHGSTLLDDVAPNVPVLILTSVDGANNTNSDFNCSFVVIDDKSNNLDATVRWYKDGVYNQTLYYNNSYANGTLVSSVLNSGNTTKNENWSCSVRIVQENYLSSGWGNSSNLTILNSLPVVTLTGPIDNFATNNRTPEFNWTYFDADDDVLTFEINITPYYGSNPSVLDVRSSSGISNLYYIPTSDLLMLYDNGYHYEWKVRANDGEENGDWSDVRKINITAEVGILLLNDEIYFGSLSIGETNSTEDASIDPFVIENNGTVFVNVSVNATQLWDTESTDSSNYQFKANETSTEAGSFDLVSSIMNWFNMPLTGFVVGIGELNYSDATDTAEIDINITVPMSEGPGQKTSTVTFMAELAE